MSLEEYVKGTENPPGPLSSIFLVLAHYVPY